jgi:hypothetical protein
VVLTVRVTFAGFTPSRVTEGCEKTHVGSEDTTGETEQLKLTLPLNPNEGVTVTL